MEEHIQELKDAEKEFEADHYEDSRSVDKHRDNSSLITGIVLIGVGGLFLLNNFTGFYLQNWWALFILIPGVKNLADAWSGFQRNGRFTDASRGSLIGGLILTTVAFTFLLSLNWGFIWPIFLIIIGIGAIMSGQRA